MLTIDCKEVSSIQNELLVYVADKVEAIPTLKNRQFTLSTFDDDAILDIELVISAIKEYFDSIHEGSNFAVISNNNFISITSISGTDIDGTTVDKSNSICSEKRGAANGSCHIPCAFAYSSTKAT